MAPMIRNEVEMTEVTIARSRNSTMRSSVFFVVGMGEPEESVGGLSEKVSFTYERSAAARDARKMVCVGDACVDYRCG